jgi:hypothetical protein
MSAKAQRLKDLIDSAVYDVTARFRALLMDRIQQQKRKMKRHLSHIQNYADRYEQSANRAAYFLVFLKTNCFPQMKDTLNLPQHLFLSLTKELNMEDVNQLLKGISKIQMSIEKRQVRIKECVKLISTPLLHTSVCVTGVSEVLHISRAMSDRVWVSDYSDIILTDTTGVTIHRVTGITPLCVAGLHTVNSCAELIYIDSDYNINKLSTDNTTVTTLLDRPPLWWPCCVYCSPTTGDLIVGMWGIDTNTAKITMYSDQLKPVLSIQHDDTGHTLYRNPRYITENRNSDIIVSDSYLSAIVVTERGGRHRFSYTGPPSASPLKPHGICTDILSHILICDGNTCTVQMIDKDGHFLSLFQTPQQEIYVPYSLDYNDKTSLFWVGSDDSNNPVCVYKFRYIQRRYPLTGKF